MLILPWVVLGFSILLAQWYAPNVISRISPQNLLSHGQRRATLDPSTSAMVNSTSELLLNSTETLVHPLVEDTKSYLPSLDNVREFITAYNDYLVVASTLLAAVSFIVLRKIYQYVTRTREPKKMEIMVTRVTTSESIQISPLPPKFSASSSPHFISPSKDDRFDRFRDIEVPSHNILPSPTTGRYTFAALVEEDEPVSPDSPSRSSATPTPDLHPNVELVNVDTDSEWTEGTWSDNCPAQNAGEDEENVIDVPSDISESPESVLIFSAVTLPPQDISDACKLEEESSLSSDSSYEVNIDTHEDNLHLESFPEHFAYERGMSHLSPEYIACDVVSEESQKGQEIVGQEQERELVKRAEKVEQEDTDSPVLVIEAAFDNDQEIEQAESAPTRWREDERTVDVAPASFIKESEQPHEEPDGEPPIHPTSVPDPEPVTESNVLPVLRDVIYLSSLPTGSVVESIDHSNNSLPEAAPFLTDLESPIIDEPLFSSTPFQSESSLRLEYYPPVFEEDSFDQEAAIADLHIPQDDHESLSLDQNIVQMETASDYIQAENLPVIFTEDDTDTADKPHLEYISSPLFSPVPELQTEPHNEHEPCPSAENSIDVFDDGSSFESDEFTDKMNEVMRSLDLDTSGDSDELKSQAGDSPVIENGHVAPNSSDYAQPSPESLMGPVMSPYVFESSATPSSASVSSIDSAPVTPAKQLFDPFADEVFPSDDTLDPSIHPGQLPEFFMSSKPKADFVALEEDD